MTLNIDLCSVDECDRTQKARGFCLMHYKRFMKYGDPLLSYAPPIKVVEICIIDDCEKVKASLGYCAMHYRRVRIHGDPLIARPQLAKQPEFCILEDCDSSALARGLCSRHYYKDQYGGKPRPVNPDICEIEDCDRNQKALGYCDMHYKRVWKHDDPNYEHVIVYKLCDEADCDERRAQFGLCSKHYYEQYNKQDIRPYFNVKHLFETGQYSEFIEAVKTQLCAINENGCWVWQKSNNANVSGGYGKITIFDKYLMAHRVMKSASLGGVDFGVEQVHHICANTLCVNPEHLQRLTQQENIAEMQERTFYKRRIIELEQMVITLQKELDETRGAEIL